MLEKPNIPDEKIIDCLQHEYGLAIAQITFLPLGVDVNAAVYCAVTTDHIPYFVKLRWGNFDEIAVKLPQILHEQGIEQIIAPLASRRGRLWIDADGCKLILYPFINGRNGYERDMLDRHWVEFGMALKKLHTANISPGLLNSIPKETYDPRWRERVKRFVEQSETGTWHDWAAIKTAALLRNKRDIILDLVARAEQLAKAIQAQTSEFVVCHADIHAGNILIDDQGQLYIVDWDSPILAPKERDLMFIGGGLFGSKRSPRQEESLFYRGYGQSDANAKALTYYRFERIIVDIAEFCTQLLTTDQGGDDREQAFEYLASNFIPNGTIEIAYQGAATRDKA